LLSIVHILRRHKDNYNFKDKNAKMEDLIFKKSDFRFGLYFVLDSTYIIYAWTVMMLKTKNAKMGKINKQM
jgi:hypothetical protein